MEFLVHNSDKLFQALESGISRCKTFSCKIWQYFPNYQTNLAAFFVPWNNSAYFLLELPSGVIVILLGI